MIVKIQHRRGAYADYDPTKVLPGELVVVQSDDPATDDGKSIYIGTAGGTIKRLATAEEIGAYNAQGAAILAQVQQTATNVQNYAQTAQTKASEANTSAQSAAQSKSAIDAIMENAENTINTYADDAKDDAIDGINQAYEGRVDEINDKIDQLVAITTDAEEIATNAKNKVDLLETDLDETTAKVDSNTSKVNGLQTDVDSMIHGWYVDVQKRIIFTDSDDNPIGNPIKGSDLVKPATTQTLGEVIVGEGLNVKADGTLFTDDFYMKPASGILKSDLASDVQTSLGKADTALQEHQDISGKANITDVQAALSTKADSSDVEALEQTVAGKADSSDVEAIEQTVAGKADTSDVEAIEDEVTTLKEELTESVGGLKSALNDEVIAVTSLRMDSLQDATFNLKPYRVIFKKIHIEKPSVINAIIVHSTGHIAGQHFNVAIYNPNFTELTTMSGKNRGGSTLRYYVETGERGFLGDDTECAIPKVELCGDYLVAYKTGAQGNSTIRVKQEESYCSQSYVNSYPSKFASGIFENSFAVDIDLAFKNEPIEISRQVTVVNNGTIHVCGIDSTKKLYGYDTSDTKIVVSADNGATWTEMCSYTYTPLQIVVDSTNSCAYYSSGARIFKITGLSSGATLDEITPTEKRHRFAMSLCESLCISHGYLWYGEYSTSTAAGDGSYDAEASNQLNYPYLLRYNLATGVWHRSAQFSARHVHCCVPDTDYLYIIVGDYNIGQDVGVHRLTFSGIVDDADLQDEVVRFTSATTESFAGRITISGQNWYNVNALIHKINNVKCLVGGSDRPLASCVVTKIEDEVLGSAVSFPQCFSYQNPPADETSWNSNFDDRGNLWVVTRETATSKLMVMTPPYNKVYVIHDFGELLPYVGGYYSSANNVMWIGNKKINLPYIGTANSITPSALVDVLGLSLDNTSTENYGKIDFLENGEVSCSIRNGNVSTSASAGIVTSSYIDVTKYQSVSCVFRITEINNASSTLRIHVDAINEHGTKVKEAFLAVTSADIGKQILRTLDVSQVSGNVKIRAYINAGSNNPNVEYGAVIQKLDLLGILNQFG